jgi:hypothetical protein
MSDSAVYDVPVDYSKKHAVRDLYRYNKLTPTSTADVLLNTGSPDVYFELPAVPANLSKSYLTFQLAIPAHASAGIGQTELFTLGVPSIARMSVYTRGGVQLVEIPDCARYLATVLPYNTKLADLIAAGDSMLATDVLVPQEVCQPIHTTGLDDGSYAARPAPFNGYTNQTLLAPVFSGTPAFCETSFSAISQLALLTSLNGVAVPAMTASYRIPLAAFKHTLLAMDKDLYFGQILIMRITFSNSAKIGHTSVDGGTTCVGLASATISKLYLNIARCADPAVAAQLVAKVQSGSHKVVIPYVHSYSYSSASTFNSINLKLNVGFGQRVLRIYNTVYSGLDIVGAEGSQYLCHNNTANALLSSYYTTLNNSRLQDQDVSAILLDDYNLMAEMIKGSAIQGHRAFRTVHCHIDNWTAGKSIEWSDADSKEIVDGLDVSQEQSYSWYVTVPSAEARVYLSYMIFQKELDISAAMITLV